MTGGEFGMTCWELGMTSGERGMTTVMVDLDGGRPRLLRMIFIVSLIPGFEGSKAILIRPSAPGCNVAGTVENSRHSGRNAVSH